MRTIGDVRTIGDGLVWHPGNEQADQTGTIGDGLVWRPDSEQADQTNPSPLVPATSRRTKRTRPLWSLPLEEGQGDGAGTHVGADRGAHGVDGQVVERDVTLPDVAAVLDVLAHQIVA